MPRTSQAGDSYDAHPRSASRSKVVALVCLGLSYLVAQVNLEQDQQMVGLGLCHLSGSV